MLSERSGWRSTMEIDDGDRRCRLSAASWTFEFEMLRRAYLALEPRFSMANYLALLLLASISVCIAARITDRSISGDSAVMESKIDSSRNISTEAEAPDERSKSSERGLALLFPDDIRKRKSEQVALQPHWLRDLCWAIQFSVKNCTGDDRWTVTVLHLQEFHELRRSQGVSDFDYAESLRTAQPVGIPSSGSGAKFYKTLDGRLILKQVSLGDIQSFMRIASAYFEHLKGRTSLAAILGAYQMTFGPTSEIVNVLVMEATDPADFDMAKFRKYDLKGLMQYWVPDSDAFFKGPLLFSPESRTKLFSIVEKDTEFLESQGLTDYSLLVFHNEEDGIVLASVIDYLLGYTWRSVFRHLKVSLCILARGWLDHVGRWLGTISEEEIKLRMKEDCVIGPRSYRMRLLRALERYFPSPSDSLK